MARDRLSLSHGAGGNTLVWYNQVPYFAKDHTVVTFDHRGWGRSICAPEDKHAKFFADDLKAVLDDAGIEVKVGGGFSGRTPLSHLQYWTDKDIIRPMARDIKAFLP